MTVPLLLTLRLLQLYAELFDKVIAHRHGGFGPNDKHKTDLDASKVKGHRPHGKGTDPKVRGQTPSYGGQTIDPNIRGTPR